MSWDEQPLPEDEGEDAPYLWWRKLRSWRRWQAAVEEWGAERDLDVRRLRALGLYPRQRPFLAETVRRTGLWLARYAYPGVTIDDHRVLGLPRSSRRRGWTGWCPARPGSSGAARRRGVAAVCARPGGEVSEAVPPGRTREVGCPATGQIALGEE